MKRKNNSAVEPGLIQVGNHKGDRSLASNQNCQPHSFRISSSHPQEDYGKVRFRQGMVEVQWLATSMLWIHDNAQHRCSASVTEDLDRPGRVQCVRASAGLVLCSNHLSCARKAKDTRCRIQSDCLDHRNRTPTCRSEQFAAGDWPFRLWNRRLVGHNRSSVLTISPEWPL